jgi:hypothetical protein
MIMYTPLPLESVLEGMDGMTDDLSEISMNGVRLQVKMLSGNQAQVVRLISPDPQQYLNPAYAPGSYIHFQPGNG